MRTRKLLPACALCDDPLPAHGCLCWSCVRGMLIGAALGSVVTALLSLAYGSLLRALL